MTRYQRRRNRRRWAVVLMLPSVPGTPHAEVRLAMARHRTRRAARRDVPRVEQMPVVATVLDDEQARLEVRQVDALGFVI